MKILVANLGSTSFKYRLFDLGDPAEPVLARGAVERIGSESSPVRIWTETGQAEIESSVPDHGVAVQLCLDQLTHPETGVLDSADEVAAIGFKAVHARNLTGVHRVDDRVLEAMDAFSDVTPAHNPPYIRAMRMLRERLPDIPLVAAFETTFHRDIPVAAQHYAVPYEWHSQFGVRRWGFHGASHRYIAERTAILLGRNDARIISCHLGGSSSLCGIREGRSIGASMGMSPQTGLPHNNRVGDFDPFALPVIMRETGMSLDGVLQTLANRSGLEGLGGVGRDLRDIEAAADSGNERAALAIDNFVLAIRHYLGAYLVDLGGAEAIVFTGGIGENSSRIRGAVCRNLEQLGIRIDPAKNERTRGSETTISDDDSDVDLWVVPTNEEIIVARQSRDLLQGISG